MDLEYTYEIILAGLNLSGIADRGMANSQRPPKGIFKRGGVYWLRYVAGGRYVRESTGTRSLREAERLLALRRAQILLGEEENGELPADRVPFERLVRDYIQDCELNRRASMERARISTNHLLRFFAGADAREFSTDKVREYVRFRQGEKTHRGLTPAPGTINRELAALKRIFRLATLSTPPKIPSVPYIPMLKEDNVRTGFFEWADIQKLLPGLPFQMKPLVLCAYLTGMRKGELLALRWKNVNVEEGIIRLEPAMTKTREGRVIYVPKNLRAEFQRLLCERNARYPECGWVFSRNGKPLKHIRRAWKTACRKAGLEGKHFHDLRRSGVRNLVRAGVPERVAMAISGHKTRSVFDRYNIVSERDLQMAAEALEVTLNGGRKNRRRAPQSATG